MKNLTAVRQRLTQDMRQLTAALQSQRAIGGYKERQKYKVGDLDLARIVDSHEQRLKQHVVKLVVLQAAVNANPLVRWLVKRTSARIARALDAVGPTL